MLRKFKLGCVYNAHTVPGGVGIPIKVTHICDGKIWFYAPDLVFEDGNEDGSYSIDSIDSIGLDCEGYEWSVIIEKLTVNYNEEYFNERFVDATKLHVLNPWFPKTKNSDIAFLFHKNIMKAFVLFFFSVKLVVLARRIKNRMYAPGGIGFIAAEESFDRAAKAIYENFEQADRAAKSQRIE